MCVLFEKKCGVCVMVGGGMVAVAGRPLRGGRHEHSLHRLQEAQQHGTARTLSTRPPGTPTSQEHGPSCRTRQTSLLLQLSPPRHCQEKAHWSIHARHHQAALACPHRQPSHNPQQTPKRQPTLHPLTLAPSMIVAPMPTTPSLHLTATHPLHTTQDNLLQTPVPSLLTLAPSMIVAPMPTIPQPSLDRHPPFTNGTEQLATSPLP